MSELGTFPTVYDVPVDAEEWPDAFGSEETLSISEEVEMAWKLYGEGFASDEATSLAAAPQLELDVAYDTACRFAARNSLIIEDFVAGILRGGNRPTARQRAERRRELSDRADGRRMELNQLRNELAERDRRRRIAARTHPRRRRYVSPHWTYRKGVCSDRPAYTQRQRSVSAAQQTRVSRRRAALI
jgi:hypothetical protein